MFSVRHVGLLLCVGLALGGCSASDAETPSTVSSVSSASFATVSDTWAPAPGADTTSWGPEDASLEGEAEVSEVAPSAPDTATESPYECEPFTEEVCTTLCGTTGTRQCYKEWGPCEVPEVCNGIDDNCDGLVDEGLTNACGGCGEVPEDICNGLDEDCDGLIDEGTANACGGCGVVPEDICNGLDDDCNGIIDDGPEGAPTDETCDGVDDDCDGLIDEGLFQACGCQGVVTSEVACVNGQFPACPVAQAATKTLHIPYLTPNCPFGEGDNLDEASAILAARVEQQVDFSFPDDQLLCSIAISGTSSDFYYDDHIILTLNDVVLITSNDILDSFATNDGLPMYAWQSIVGNGNGGDGPYCLPGATVCQMPGTQENGEVSIAFDEATSDLLVQTGQDGEHTFTAIVTGDNDPPKDCHHNGFSIAINYTYVLN